MRAGIPIICSNTTSMPEVGGDAVLYADPSDLKEIADAMREMEENEQLRKNLVDKGFEQMRRFSWDKTARLLWASVEKMMQTY